MNFPVLPLRGFVKPIRDRLRVGRGLRDLIGRAVDPLDERTQFLDGEIDRVGDRAGHILGHRRLHREVAVGQVTHLVQQTQNRFLVTLVLLLAFEGTRLLLVVEHLGERGGENQRQHGKQNRGA